MFDDICGIKGMVPPEELHTSGNVVYETLLLQSLTQTGLKNKNKAEKMSSTNFIMGFFTYWKCSWKGIFSYNVQTWNWKWIKSGWIRTMWKSTWSNYSNENHNKTRKFIRNFEVFIVSINSDNYINSIIVQWEMVSC